MKVQLLLGGPKSWGRGVKSSTGGCGPPGRRANRRGPSIIHRGEGKRASRLLGVQKMAGAHPATPTRAHRSTEDRFRDTEEIRVQLSVCPPKLSKSLQTCVYLVYE